MSPPTSATTISSTTHRESIHEIPKSEATDQADGLCPVQESIKLIGRKWHLIVLWELSQRSRGFNELKGAARGISAKMLSQSLSDLEENGLVVRDVLTERPLRVSYRLTEKAYGLVPMFEVLHEWGQRHGLTAEPVMA